MRRTSPADNLAWQDEGRRAAGALEDVAAAVVTGRNSEQAADVAVGIALALCDHRQVVLADLVGELDPLYELAGGDDALGLTDCLRDGLPLNDIARRALAHDTIFVLPAGTPPVATLRTLGHERWPKLVRGFAEAGALLLLVAPLDGDGIDTLVSATQAVVAEDTPPQLIRRFPLVATVDAPAGYVDSTLPVRRAAPKGRRWAVAALLCLTIGAGGLLWWRSRPRPTAALSAAGGANEASGAAGQAPGTAGTTPASASGPTVAPPHADTIRLGDPVNGADSASSAFFAVEVVAANTVAGANSVLRDGATAAPLPAPTVAPVALGGGTLWYQAVVGAWRTRTGADSLLAALRARGVVREGEGRVVRRPYALLLENGVSREVANAAVAVWLGRGIGAYALEQDDGRVRVFAGAFETPLQAASLAAWVRDAGTTPVMAIRTGRTY